MSAHSHTHDDNRPYLEVGRSVWGWLSTTDHKKIGVMFLFVIFFYFAIAGISALLVRLELIAPGSTFFTPDTYNVQIGRA